MSLPDSRGPASGTAPSGTAPRFPAPVEEALRTAGWRPGRREMGQAELWADALRDHVSPGGHRHAILPAAVEAWAEFGTLRLTPRETGWHIAPTTVLIDPLAGLHAARTFVELGRALDTELCPLGAELCPPGTTAQESALLAVDARGRVYGVDHAGDWYLGRDIDTALITLLTGVRPVRLTASAP